jgi:hypothetical protein
MVSFNLIWALMGASGAIFCIAALGGLDALPAFTPFTPRGAARLLVACAIGAGGGYFGGWLIQGDSAAVNISNYPTLGVAWGAALGTFLAPFTVFGLYHLLEYRLRTSGALRSSLGWRIMGTSGWVIVLVAPLLGYVIGERLGAVSGSADVLLGNAAAPFAGGVFVFIIPLLFWLIGRTESCYLWTSDIRTQAPVPEITNVRVQPPIPDALNAEHAIGG